MSERQSPYWTPELQARTHPVVMEPLLSQQAQLPAIVTRSMRGIRGLTDRAPEFARIGELRKGAKKINDRQPGKDLGPVFRFTSDSQETAETFTAKFGHEPREIEVYMPYRNADDVFMACKEAWVAGGMVHRCDGVTCSVYRGTDGKMHTDPAPCPGGCKETGRLKVIVKELGRLGIVTALTTSKHDIMRLTEQLRAYETLRGDLRGIPFTLSRRRVMVSTPTADGKRARREKWLLSIEPKGDWVVAQLRAMEMAALPVTDTPLLMAPDDSEVVALDEPAMDFDDDDDDVTVDNETGEITPAARATPERVVINPDGSRGVVTDGNGKAAVQANNDSPTTPAAALVYVNSRVQVPYDVPIHMFNAIKQELGGVFQWPKDADGWAIAVDAAIRHANAKVQPPARRAMALRGEMAQATIADGMRGDYEEGGGTEVSTLLEDLVNAGEVPA